MKKSSRYGVLRAALGFLKVIGLLLMLPFALIWWCIRGAVARARFRSQLRAAGVPKEAADRLSKRYKIELKDFKALKATITH